MSIHIEKNVPIPQRSRLPDMPFRDMQVGDSFRPSARQRPEVDWSLEAEGFEIPTNES